MEEAKVWECVVRYLGEQRNRSTLDTLMLTCNCLRMRISTSIIRAKITIKSPDSLQLECFPSHATLRTLDLAMRPEEATAWLSRVQGVPGTVWKLRKVSTI